MTTIGPAVGVVGELACDDDLQIDGRVRGYIHVGDATLTIGAHGRVHADLRGARVLVHGQVQGSIWASERIELSASASVTGSLSANQVVLADGARFQGFIDMDRRTVAARVARFRTANR